MPYILMFILLLTSCSSPAYREVVVREVKVHVVGERGELPCGTYGCVHKGEIWVLGSTDGDGKVVLNDMVLGHEMRHVLNKTDGVFKNPDEDWMYRVYKWVVGE